MEFDKESFEATSEVMALATICEQTPMGEMGNGAFAFAYGKDALAALPGENKIGFTMVDVQNGVRSDLATNAIVSKILTSGQIFDKNGYLNNNLETFIDAQAGQVGSIDALRAINARDPQIGRQQVRGLNQTLVGTLSQSPDWARDFVERARVFRGISLNSNNNCVQATVQKLGEYVQLARDTSQKNVIANINENVQSR